MRTMSYCPRCGTRIDIRASSMGVCPQCEFSVAGAPAAPNLADIGVLPFTLSNVCGGFAEAHGLARIVGQELVLEFEVKDAFVGAIKSGLSDVRVPLREIRSVELEEGWVRTNVSICAASLAAFHDVPTAEQGRVRLAVRRKDKEAARAFVQAVQARIAAGTVATDTRRPES